jgi:hypothetical protein
MARDWLSRVWNFWSTSKHTRDLKLLTHFPCGVKPLGEAQKLHFKYIIGHRRLNLGTHFPYTLFINKNINNVQLLYRNSSTKTSYIKKLFGYSSVHGLWMLTDIDRKCLKLTTLYFSTLKTIRNICIQIFNKWSIAHNCSQIYQEPITIYRI